MKLTRICWIAIGCLILGAAATSAQSKTAEGLFAKHDKDHDGSITRAEFVGIKQGEAATLAGERFDLLDADRDDRVTLNELEPYLFVRLSFRDTKTPEEIFERRDKDGNGEISREEFVGNRQGESAARAERAFAKIDRTPDGGLTLEEFRAAREHRAARRAQRQTPN